MKNLKSLKILFLALVTFSCSSTKEIPNAVNEAFAKKFPNAKSVKWDKETETEWEAEFKMDGMEYSANFTDEG
ncbi:MAG: hypothetical protein V7767_13365, partial [Leeuwenhoekiella sp.]